MINQEQEAILRFSLQAGMFRRGAVRRWIVAYCKTYELQCVVQEEKGWLESVLFFRIEGKQSYIQPLYEWVKAVMKLQ